jgi:DHA2 family multidrug resistance protein-like MFS transporter
MSEHTRDAATSREWLGLAVLALPTLLVSIDVFVMLLALPHLSAALHATGPQQLWIMDTYGFLLAGFLITMGNLGDRIGRKRLLLIGSAGFGVASVLAAYATSPTMLIVARAILGIAGSTIAPSSLALISNMFRDANQRRLAIGIWLACFIGGAATGPLVGGLMLARFWWGSVFLIGVPAMLLLLALGPVFLPEYRSDTAGPLDPRSVALSLLGILPCVYGLKTCAVAGPSLKAVAAMLIGGAFLVAFILRQRRLSDPLLDLKLFGHREFRTALSCMFFGTLLMGSLMVFITGHLQLVSDLTPLATGLWMLPAMAASVIGFLSSPMLARRIAPAHLIAGGLLVSVAGLIGVATVSTDDPPVVLALCFAIINLGAGPFVSLGTDLVVGAVPPAKAGSAAALNQTSGEFGFSLGIAVLGSVGAAVYRGHLGGAPQAARDSLPAALELASRRPDGAVLASAARAAYTAQLHVAAGISAAILIVVAVVVWRGLRPYERPGRGAGGDTEPYSPATLRPARSGAAGASDAGASGRPDLQAFLGDRVAAPLAPAVRPGGESGQRGVYVFEVGAGASG